MRNPFARKHPVGEEGFSAYLDGRLPTGESARLEAHLASCEPCRRRLAELRAVVEGLRGLSPIAAPRSFALRPEQVERPRRRISDAPVAPARVMQAFGPAGAAVAALLVLAVLVGVDVGTLRGGGGAEGGQTTQLAADKAREAGVPVLGAAPAPTPAPAAAPPETSGEQSEPNVPPATAEAGQAAPAQPSGAAGQPAFAAPSPPPPEGGSNAARWVLRGFEGAAGAAFLGAVGAFVWQRRRGSGAPSA